MKKNKKLTQPLTLNKVTISNLNQLIQVTDTNNGNGIAAPCNNPLVSAYGPTNTDRMSGYGHGVPTYCDTQRCNGHTILTGIISARYVC